MLGFPPFDIGVTGHRPDKVARYETRIKTYFHKLLTETPNPRVFTGMALGVDTYMTEVCVELGVPYVAMVPFRGQERLWPAADRERYWKLLEWAHEEVVVSPGGYDIRKMQVRNARLVDRCDHLYAIWDGSSGGTSNCVAYARAVKKGITVVDPHTLPR